MSKLDVTHECTRDSIRLQLEKYKRPQSVARFYRIVTTSSFRELSVILILPQNDITLAHHPRHSIEASCKLVFKECEMFTYHKSLIVALTVLMFLIVAPSVLAVPPSQGMIPCFGGEGCPEPVNPEPDEYYS